MVTIEIDLPDTLVTKIRELKDSLQLTNEAEVISYAILLLDKIEEAKLKGNKIVIQSSEWGGYYPSSSSTTSITIK